MRRWPVARECSRGHEQPEKDTRPALERHAGPLAGSQRRFAEPERKPRDASSAFFGWDLGRNDHTDEVGLEAPRGAFVVVIVPRRLPVLGVASKKTELPSSLRHLDNDAALGGVTPPRSASRRCRVSHLPTAVGEWT